MDAAVKKRPRSIISSQRKERWSMNSQRLEKIVAELMRPIGDLRHSFDTDLSALLEEYLTEAGLHALEEESEDSDLEDSGVGSGLHPVVPNFAELALLLQHSASVYGRKVDFLYQHVISVSDSLNNSTLEISNPHPEESEPATPSGRGRKRRSSNAAITDFVNIALEPSNVATRDPEPPRPPPTLPRVYIELEPRVMTDNDAPLYDYANEPIGLLADFHVAWRLQDGLLVDELESDPSTSGSLRPISLVELQAAIEANAPPAPPLLSSTPLPDATIPVSPPCTPPPLDMDTPQDTPLQKVKRERKRRNEVNLDDISPLNIKLLISKEVRRELSSCREFSVPEAWIRAEIRARSRAIIATRRKIKDQNDYQGFHGWSNEEACVAKEAACLLNSSLSKGWGVTGTTLGGMDSDDDGFFERSSLGDSDSGIGRTEDSSLSTMISQGPSDSGVEWEVWQASVVRRAAEAEARGGVDVRQLGKRVIDTLPADESAVPFQKVLSSTVETHNDVSRLFLATLFLANSGNVEILQDGPLTLNSFSVRLVSSDDALLRAAAAAAVEDQTLR